MYCRFLGILLRNIVRKKLTIWSIVISVLDFGPALLWAGNLWVGNGGFLVLVPEVFWVFSPSMFLTISIARPVRSIILVEDVRGVPTRKKKIARIQPIQINSLWQNVNARHIVVTEAAPMLQLV